MHARRSQREYLYRPWLDAARHPKLLQLFFVSKHIWISVSVCNDGWTFDELPGPCFYTLNPAGMQDDVVPFRFVIGELFYAWQDERSSANFKGQRLK